MVPPQRIAPVSAKDGSELFFIEPESPLRSIQPWVRCRIGRRCSRSQTNTMYGEATYEPPSDDERFLMVRDDEGDTQDAAKFVVVQNWFTELRERMGGN
jgi:hypothetical protein